MELDIRNWNVEIVTDLYHAGMTEDGSPYHAESYYLVIRDIKGKRLAHNMVFRGCEVEIDDEIGMTFFCDVRKDAMAQVERLLDRVNRVGKINTDYWHEVEPAYGSEYYCQIHKF